MAASIISDAHTHRKTVTLQANSPANCHYCKGSPCMSKFQNFLPIQAPGSSLPSPAGLQAYYTLTLSSQDYKRSLHYNIDYGRKKGDIIYVYWCRALSCNMASRPKCLHVKTNRSLNVAAIRRRYTASPLYTHISRHLWTLFNDNNAPALKRTRVRVDLAVCSLRQASAPLVERSAARTPGRRPGRPAFARAYCLGLQAY